MMMWKETPSSSRTERSSSTDPGKTPLSMVGAPAAGIVHPVVEPEAALPAETAISTKQNNRKSIVSDGEYKIVMSCHVEQGDPSPLVERETASLGHEWIGSTGGKRGHRTGQ